MKQWSKFFIIVGLRGQGAADQSLAIGEGFKTPSNKVQISDGEEGEKSRRELCSVYTEGPATWELVPMRFQLPKCKPNSSFLQPGWILKSWFWSSSHYLSIYIVHLNSFSCCSGTANTSKEPWVSISSSFVWRVCGLRGAWGAPSFESAKLWGHKNP